MARRRAPGSAVVGDKEAREGPVGGPEEPRGSSLLKTTAVLGAAGVALGAFGAHALPRLGLAPRLLAAWDTGVKYHLLHTTALLGLSLHLPSVQEGSNSHKWLTRAANSMVAGIALFSGSIYGLCLTPYSFVFGPMTPIGGFFLIGGWLCLLGM